ncbi:WD40 repeat-like protein [Lentinula edodes]|uniref:WD40 repeat-like protein n=1 Tax=Lentinula edodes TaxID=5353 RepID=A0A1Q3EF47_LENED|nr:WD40 repeat-like protein [Lentinula edodes]
MSHELACCIMTYICASAYSCVFQERLWQLRCWGIAPGSRRIRQLLGVSILLKDYEALSRTSRTCVNINSLAFGLETDSYHRLLGQHHQAMGCKCMFSGSTLKAEFNHHRTKITELYLSSEQLWTASSDETVQVRYLSEAEKRPTPPPIHHATAVRCILPLHLTDLQEPYIITGSGDFMRVYDVSSANEPELLNEIDAHWRDITHIRLWMRQSVDEKNNQKRIEPWIITTSLDCTVRRWRLSELLVPKPKITEPPVSVIPPQAQAGFAMTLEEEQELDELLNSD